MNPIGSLLDTPAIAHLRRNHALEHATIHLLSQRYRPLAIVGRTSIEGFTLYGPVPTEVVVSAAQEALRRLRAGQYHLAVHPRCGTNLVLAGTLAGLASFIVLSGKPKDRWAGLARLPSVFLAATLALILAQPLGVALQSRVTTEPDVGDLRIVEVTRRVWAGIVVHHVRTQGRALSKACPAVRQAHQPRSRRVEE